jgi:D-tyrosyl-tRNA(Tyr) deacylase
MISSPTVRAVVQRVAEASVRVAGERVASIGPGLVVLLGVATNDTEADADSLADKVLNLRVFPDEAGQMNRSVLDISGGLLVVSQFTLLGDAQGAPAVLLGRRHRPRRRSGATSSSCRGSGRRA